MSHALRPGVFAFEVNSLRNTNLHYLTKAMYVNPLQISLETLIGAGPMLGHGLEDRSTIRDAQDWSLVRRLQAQTSTRLRSEAQQRLFAVAPLDVLMTQAGGDKQFHIIEINGTGIGGLTNMTADAIGAVLDDLCEMAQEMDEADPIILIASSGKENDQSPRLNKLLHEKVLYAEALKRGFEYAGETPRVVTMTGAIQTPASFPTSGPTIVLGYMKEFLDHLRLEQDGRLSLFGRPVTAAINDRFCLNVLHHFDDQVDLNQFWTLNRGFLAGADKGVAYDLLDECLRREPRRFFPEEVAFARVFDQEELTETVLAWVRKGRRCVIKPQGTGLGHGIEFFLDPSEDETAIKARIDRSVRLTESYYGLPGGAFPYTVCEYLDTCSIPEASHPLHGHKFELRIVVYRDGMELKAFPSILKIASEKYDAAKPARLSLINNITTSAQAKKAAGVEFMLPLANRETLKMLGLTWEHLVELCRSATEFVRFVLDKVEDEPERLGLPANIPVSSRRLMGAVA